MYSILLLRIHILLIFLLLCIRVNGQYINKIGEYKFLENKGQWIEKVAFKGTIPNGDLFVFDDGIGYLLTEKASNLTEGKQEHPHKIDTVGQGSFHALKLSFGKAKKLQWKPIDRSSDYYNFLYGNDSSLWYSQLYTYQQIYARDLYDGIDIRLILDSHSGFKYEFLLGPRAKTNLIKMTFDGADELSILDGALYIKTSVGDIVERPPYAYQFKDSVQIEITCEFVIKKGIVSFKLGKYDHNLPLVIDPKLIFSTSAGSRADYWGNTACNDDEGNLYTGGTLFSHDGNGSPEVNGFPTSLGAFQTFFQGGGTDMGIMKFDSSGTNLLYSTYLGGDQSEIPTSLVVDEKTKELLILGTTGSSNFPIVNPTNSYDPNFSGGLPVLEDDLVGGYEFPNGTDIIVVRLSADGTSILNSTYLGGSGTDGINRNSSGLVYNYGDQLRGDIFMDDSGAVYIASVTSIPTNPIDSFPLVGGFGSGYLGGASDGVLVKMKNDLTAIIWSNLIGGKGADAAYSVKIDSNYNLLVAGGTRDTILSMPLGGVNPYPIGRADGYIMRISGDGTIPLAGSYIGTSSYDQVFFIDLDQDETVYVLGQTRGVIPKYSSFGTVYGNPNNGVFIQKFSQDFSSILVSTTIGDTTSPSVMSSNISPTAFLVNDCGNIFISGWGGYINSRFLGYGGDFIRNMPISAKAYKTTTDGDDFYLLVLFKNAELMLYGTYFGGNTSLEHVDGGTSRFDKSGTVYQSVCANCGGNRDFPTYPDDGNSLTYPMRSKSNNCNNGLFKFDLANLEALIEGPTCLVTGEEYHFRNLSTGGINFVWDFGDGTSEVFTEKLDSVSHIYTKQGEYTIRMIATDLVTCVGKDTTYFEVAVINDIEIIGDTLFCTVNSILLNVDNSINPYWSSKGELSCQFCTETIAAPTDTTWYFVKDSIGANGCFNSDSIRLDLNDLPLIAAFDMPTCQYLNEEVQFLNNSTGGEEFIWDFGDGNLLFTTKDTNVFHIYSERNSYNVSLKIINKKTCSETNLLMREIGILDDIVCFGDTTICPFQSVVLKVKGADFPEWTPSNTLSCTYCIEPIATPTDTTIYIVKDSLNGGCFVTDTVVVNVKQKPNPLISIQTTDFKCYNEPITFIGNVNENDCDCCIELTDWFWDFGDGTTSVDLQPTHEYKGEGIYNVSLRALGYDTVIGFQAIELYTLDSCLKNIFIPNAFTPNGDGENDVLYVRGINVVKLDFRLFNRWGEEVFYTNQLSKGWNSFYKGKKQTQQVFVFKCSVTFYDGERRKFEGNITLLE